MNDFASAAMIRVLAQGMGDLGLVPPQAALQPQAAATVPLALKRALVGAALQQGGLACLAQLGRGLRHFAYEPTHQALLGNGAPADVLQRWQRLERYIHSRHRVRLESIGPREALLKHVALRGEAPLPAEDLVVLGVIAALLESGQSTALEVRIAGVSVLPQPDAAGLATLAQRGQTAQWQIRWELPAIQRPVQEPPARVAPAVAGEPGWSILARQVFDELSADLMQRAGLPVIARRLGLAPRSLQRKLAQEGLSLTSLFAEARSRHAAHTLLHGRLPLAEVGFLAGYADQPHFTRDFTRRVGLPPARFRAEFGVGLDRNAGLTG